MGRYVFVVIVLTIIAVVTGCHSSVLTLTTPETIAAHQPVALGPPVVITSGSCHAIDGKADRRCTPGAINSLVLQDAATHYSHTICSVTPRGQVSWTRQQRPPTSYTNSIKALQMPEYGLSQGKPTPAQMSTVEEDHFFPLEAGGAPMDTHNLWPEPWTGTENAHDKDTDENYAHREICGPDRWTVERAFVYIQSRWSHN